MIYYLNDQAIEIDEGAERKEIERLTKIKAEARQIIQAVRVWLEGVQ